MPTCAGVCPDWRISNSEPPSSLTYSGTTVDVTCNEGYSLVGDSANVTCSGGVFEPEVRCVEQEERKPG